MGGVPAQYCDLSPSTPHLLDTQRDITVRVHAVVFILTICVSPSPFPIVLMHLADIDVDASALFLVLPAVFTMLFFRVACQPGSYFTVTSIDR